MKNGKNTPQFEPKALRVNPDLKFRKYGNVFVWQDAQGRTFSGYVADDHPAHNSPPDSFAQSNGKNGGAK